VETEKINYGTRARIGVILPSGNLAAEAELMAMMPRGVSVHITRLPLAGSQREQLLGMIEDVESAALLLKDAQPDLIVFHCTAVSTWDAGLDDAIRQRIYDSTGIPATTTAHAIVAALRTLGSQNIVLVSPYVEEINRRETDFLSLRGVRVLAACGLALSTPKEMFHVETREWIERTVAERDENAEAYFISCTAVRSLGAVAPLEEILERPVITSNQAMAWHALRNVGVTDKSSGFGSLFMS
jgi:maleate isomerase